MSSGPLKPTDLPKVGTGSAAKLLSKFVGKFSSGLKGINPFLSDANLNAVVKGEACDSRQVWDICNNDISLFSGLSIISQNNKEGFLFAGVTDRGPNQACEDIGDAKEDDDTEWEGAWTVANPNSFDGGQGFPVRRFAPTMFALSADHSGKVIIEKSCYLKKTNGKPINGLSNIEGYDNTPYGAVCKGNPLNFSTSGLDTEDIQKIPGTNLYIMADEYSPSIVIVNGEWDKPSCGKIIARYVPKGLAELVTTENAGYPIYHVLPDVLLSRRGNRGLENIAVLPDGKTVLAMLQSPLGDSDEAKDNSHVITAIMLSIADISKPKLLGTYLYIAEPVGGSKGWLDKKAEPKDTKVSAFSPVGSLLGLPNDWPVVLALERSKKQVKIFLVDFGYASDVSNLYGGDPLKFDELGGRNKTLAQLRNMGIKVAAKVLVLDTGHLKDSPKIIDWDDGDKQEGVVALNKCVLAIGSDNDFGFGDADPCALNIVQLPKCLNEYYTELSDSKLKRPPTLSECQAMWGQYCTECSKTKCKRCAVGYGARPGAQQKVGKNACIDCASRYGKKCSACNAKACTV